MGAYSIPLQVGAGVQPIQSPAQAAGSVLGPMQLAGAVQIQRQQQQENALKIQAAQEDERDQGTFQDALNNHTTFDADGKPQLDWDSAINEAAPKMRLRNVQAIQRDHLLIQQTARQLASSNVQDDINKFKKATMLNDAMGRELYSVYSLPEDQKAEGYSDAIDRMKMLGASDPQTAAWISSLPQSYPGGDAGQKLLRSGMIHAGYIGQAMKSAKDEAAANKNAQDEARKDLQDRVSAGAARLSTANTGNEYNQVLSSLDKDVQQRFAQLPQGTDPSQPIDQDFLDNVRQRGLTAKDQTTSANRLTGIDARRKSAEEHAANIYGKDIMAALREVGAKDITNPTPQEMKKARAAVAQQKLSEKKTGGTDASNPLGIPGWK